MRALAGLLLALALGAAQAEVAIPPLGARVTDLTSTLEPGQRASLEARLAAFERAKGSQIAVLILPTTQPEAIEQYGIRLAEAWQIGRKGVDDGVILLIAKDDRKLRIEVGYGLEGALPDVIAKRIIEEVITPRFRAGDFYGGVADGVERIIGVIEGEPLPEPAPAPISGELAASVMPGIIVLLVVGTVVRRIFGALPGGALAGTAAGIGAWAITSSLIVALVAAIFFGLAVMVMGYGRRGGWSSGGGSWGGGSWSSGGGGGGFSGGGGSFGGGGASGGW